MITQAGIITENKLDEWVRGNSQIAQGVIVELVWRLVAAASPNPKVRHFPLGDSIGQPGPDGYLETDFGLEPFVPVGKSYWEIGTGDKPGNKATEDYRNLTKQIPGEVRKDSTFVFITPLSGRKTWAYSWKENAQAKWLSNRRKLNEWKDVKVFNGTVLIDWLRHFPAVELWLAAKMDFPVEQIETPEQHWAVLRTIGDPPPLPPNVFLINRDSACAKLKELFSGNILQLQLDTHFPDQVTDFVSAYIAAMSDEARADTTGRALILSGASGWNVITALPEPHVLIADFDLGDNDELGTRLLERAKRAKHTVIRRGVPGGIPHPNRVSIPSPTVVQIEDTLKKAGYLEERARAIAQKSGGNISSLLRCLQNLSLLPEWSQGTDAAELAIAELLGSWDERTLSDTSVSEQLSKKAYGEWVAKMREIALRPGTPLIQRDGAWKFIARFEGWYVLGKWLFDDHLDRLGKAAVSVLREKNPKFDLDINERYAAGIHGKILTHSGLLRVGLAETLALLGSHPKALTSCTFGKAESIATLAVRNVLTDADWILWASLNDVLPLLAEAAPSEFLDVLEDTLNSNPDLFKKIFEQEGHGFTGSNYMTGLLWGLETLAWDTQYLTRVVIILGQLANIDIGGQWANRPANSLSTILLPWLPQTCASVPNRVVAIKTLIKELPDVGWRLVLGLLPSSHQMSLGSRKPAWRNFIPDNWSMSVVRQEYWDQIEAYAKIAVDLASTDVSKLTNLIERLADLPSPAAEQIFTYLQSEAVSSLPEKSRLPLWNALIGFVGKHRKYADADSALKPELLRKIEKIAECIMPDAPVYRYQRLFVERDYDLFEQKGNYEEQFKELQNLRENAVNEIFISGGFEAVLEFAKSVESPWQVGIALGSNSSIDVEKNVIPAFLVSENRSLSLFTGGFINALFWSRKWAWVDSVDLSLWTPEQRGQFLAYLPFVSDTWKRVASYLTDDESSYWSKTSVNPYQTEGSLDWAIERLVKYSRPHEALRCLGKLVHLPNFNSRQAINVLLSMLSSTKMENNMDIYAIVDVIKALQKDPKTNQEDLFKIEWAYLPLLDHHNDATPQLLEQRLADDPSFFCEVIRISFKSKKSERTRVELTSTQKDMATNAYRLLNGWRIPPGSRKNTVYDGDALNTWLEKVKEICKESGHLEIALEMVGHVLIHAPSDPDGLWLHRSVADILNNKEAGDIREGFIVALYNSRGVHVVSNEHLEEQNLAKKYRFQAEEVESRGYHRLATSLKKLASSYEHEAKRNESGEPFDD